MSTEAMKLALEALESCDTGHITDGSRQWYDERLVDKAITALDEALAQPQQEIVASKLLKQEEEIKSLRNDLRRAHDAYCQLTREPPYTLHIPTSTQAADG